MFNQTAFINNKARKEGGAVKWTFLKPELINCSFKDNTAPYGNNIASFPVRFSVQFYDNGKKIKIKRIKYNFKRKKKQLFCNFN